MKAWTQDVHYDYKLSPGTEAPSGNDRVSPAWLYKLQLKNTGTHAQNQSYENQQYTKTTIFFLGSILMFTAHHTHHHSFSFDTPYIVLIKGEPSHSLNGSKYTPSITFFYSSQLLCLRGSVGLTTSNYIVMMTVWLWNLPNSSNAHLLVCSSLHACSSLIQAWKFIDWALRGPTASHFNMTDTDNPNSALSPLRHIIQKTMDWLNADFKKHMPMPDAAFYLHSLKFTYIPFIFYYPTFIPTFVQ